MGVKKGVDVIKIGRKKCGNFFQQLIELGVSIANTSTNVAGQALNKDELGLEFLKYRAVERRRLIFLPHLPTGTIVSQNATSWGSHIDTGVR